MGDLMCPGYNRDVLGRIHAVNLTDNGQTATIVTNIAYTADGLLVAQTFSNGLLETRSYNTQRCLTTWQLGGVSNRTFNYDAAGNLVSRSLNAGNQTFSYDAACQGQVSN